MIERLWRRFGRLGLLLSLVASTAVVRAEGPGTFTIPADRATWQQRRESVRSELWQALGDLPPRPKVPEFKKLTFQERDGCYLAEFRFDNGAGSVVPGVLLQPKAAPPERGFPAILYLHSEGPDGRAELFEPNPWGEPAGLELVRRGFAVLAIDAYGAGQRAGRGPSSAAPDLFKTFLAEGKTLWGMMIRDDLMSLDGLVSMSWPTPIDAKRIGVTGKGLGALRALWLMALDERFACGVDVAGLTRFADLIAARGQGAVPLSAWVPGLLRRFDTEALVALCAPRPFTMMVGDRDPAAPIAGARRLIETAHRAYALYDKDDDYTYTRTVFGGLGHEFTPLEWDMMLEVFDKHFLPQGPTPLGHAPEPEPTIDDRFVDLARHGIAGWVAEMSQRPTTWTWRDGLIVCDPGPFEYGWLRAPIEADDFVLSVEWQVPEDGNSGIFLRARPVDWTIPPGPSGKERVATLGLDWPSRTGLELQATDDHGRANKYSSGSLYRHAAPSSNPTRPAGEWNHYTVRCRGLRVEVWCNGEQVLDARLDRLPTLRHVPLRGYFGLQNHGVGAKFRKVLYSRLEPGSERAQQP